MSNEPTIEQMNEAIALFIGGCYIKEHGGKRYVYYPKSCARDVAELKYHSSWDWLRPVWNKFRDLKFMEETPMKLHLNYVARLAQDIAYGTIEEVHHNIHISIQWYNKQSTTTNDNTTGND